jgi:hypothetical protein
VRQVIYSPSSECRTDSEHPRITAIVIDLAARLVVTTNEWPGLRHLYHGAYDAGLSFTVRRLRSIPGVAAIMLRVGDEGREWVPGLSDYDLTVLIEPTDAIDIVELLGALWARYRAIKRFVPQIGEMEVMTVEEHGDFVRFGPMPTASLKHAEPLFVRSSCPHALDSLRPKPSISGAEEFTRDALSRYLRFLFPAWLEYARDPSNIARRRVEHRLANICKRLRRLDVRPDVTSSVEDKFVAVFKALTNACARLESSKKPPAEVAPRTLTPVLCDAIEELAGAHLRIVHGMEPGTASLVAWVSFMSLDRVCLAFVVSDDIPDCRLRDLATRVVALQQETATLARRWCANGALQMYFPSVTPGVILSRSMWESWRELSPFDGAAIAASGRLLAGRPDLLRSPSARALRRGAEVHLASLLPLKNNWRPSGGRPPVSLYAAMVNHVSGYSSALSGPVETSASDRQFGSVVDGYRSVSAELSALRSHLLR